MNSFICLFLSGLFLIIVLSTAISPSFAVLTKGTHDSDFNDFQEHITSVFDLGSAVFSAFIIVLTIVAYRKLRSKRILLISAAFILFFTRSLLSIFDLVQPEIRQPDTLGSPSEPVRIYSQLHQTLAQGVAVDAEHLRCAKLVAAGRFEHFAEFCRKGATLLSIARKSAEAVCVRL